MERIVKIGARKSPLALRQVDEILDLLAGRSVFFPYAIDGIDTRGDKDKKTPISEIEGSDFFTHEIDRALLEKKIDCAVHSAKDLPDEVLEGLAVVALTKAIDPTDALVSANRMKLSQLPAGARIGVSSRRRKSQIKELRPDLKIVDIRGTIDERLAQLCEGKIDAAVIASAALIRLGLQDLISERLDPTVFKPHPQQGRLAVLVRSEDEELKKMFSVIDSGKVHESN